MKSKRNQSIGPVPAREFIRIWQGADSLAEVAAKVRRKKSTCRVRAFRYRRLGVPLKVFPWVEPEEINWDELAEYAAELAANESGAVDPDASR
jgi:hypothetical protein